MLNRKWWKLQKFHGRLPAFVCSPGCFWPRLLVQIVCLCVYVCVYRCVVVVVCVGVHNRNHTAPRNDTGREDRNHTAPLLICHQASFSLKFQRYGLGGGRLELICCGQRIGWGLGDWGLELNGTCSTEAVEGCEVSRWLGVSVLAVWGEDLPLNGEGCGVSRCLGVSVAGGAGRGSAAGW